MKINKNKISKLFGVLVVGGAMIAYANDPAPTEKEEDCELEVTLNNAYDFERMVPKKYTTCIDDKSDEEILSIIKEKKKAACYTPHCGCWLG